MLRKGFKKRRSVGRIESFSQSQEMHECLRTLRPRFVHHQDPVDTRTAERALEFTLYLNQTYVINQFVGVLPREP